MSDEDDPESTAEGGTRPPAPEQPSRGRTGSRKQDWIASQLRQVYDEALQDAIPESMLKLLDELDTPPGKPK